MEEGAIMLNVEVLEFKSKGNWDLRSKFILDLRGYFTQ